MLTKKKQAQVILITFLFGLAQKLNINGRNIAKTSDYINPNNAHKDLKNNEDKEHAPQLLCLLVVFQIHQVLLDVERT